MSELEYKGQQRNLILDESYFDDVAEKIVKLFATPDVSISLERVKKYAKHQYYLGTQKQDFVEFKDWKVEI